MLPWSLSRRALDDPAKPWVARETSLLVWRQALDPTLRLVPVVLPGVDPAELAQGRFVDLQLREIQCLRADADPVQTAARVVAGLALPAGQPKATPLDALAGQIAARLRGLERAAIIGAGALTAAIDRPLPPDHAEVRDSARSARRSAPTRR
jgi:hypothetical protein